MQNTAGEVINPHLYSVFNMGIQIFYLRSAITARLMSGIGVIRNTSSYQDKVDSAMLIIPHNDKDKSTKVYW